MCIRPEEDFTISTAKSSQFLLDTSVSAATVTCLADLLFLTRASLTNRKSTLFYKINGRKNVNQFAYFPHAPP